jgi:hypothetical protein
MYGCSLRALRELHGEEGGKVNASTPIVESSFGTSARGGGPLHRCALEPRAPAAPHGRRNERLR